MSRNYLWLVSGEDRHLLLSSLEHEIDDMRELLAHEHDNATPGEDHPQRIADCKVTLDKLIKLGTKLSNVEGS